MANSSDVSSPPVPDVKREAGECPPDNKLPERTSMHGLTTPSRKPSPRAIPYRSTSPQGRSLIALLRKFPPHRGMTSRITQSRTQLSTF